MPTLPTTVDTPVTATERHDSDQQVLSATLKTAATR